MTMPPPRCAEVAPYLAAFADGEVAEPLRTRLAEHLAGCADCASEVERVRGVSLLLRHLPQTTPSAAVLERVQTAVAAQEQAREAATRRTLAWRPRAGGPSRGAAALLVASLLVAMAALLLGRGAWYGNVPGSMRATGTPTPSAPTLEVTRQAVQAVRGELDFAPVLPTYLPAGARLLQVRTSPAGAPPAARSLEVLWAVDAPLRTLRLTEAPSGVGWGAYQPAAADARLSWQVGAAPWRPLVVANDAAARAVGQERPGLRLALEASAPAEGEAAALVALRLTSLSLDAPYAPPSILPRAQHGEVQHFTALVAGSDAAARVEVYVDAARAEERIEVRDGSGRLLFVETAAGGEVTRWDPVRNVVQRLPQAQTDRLAELDTSATQLFYDANSRAAFGELWPTGQATYRGEVVTVLRLVNAPAVTEVLVSQATHQVVAVRTLSGPPEQPGGPLARTRLLTPWGCPLTLVEYVPRASVPASTFTPSVPADATPGSVPRPAHCG